MLEIVPLTAPPFLRFEDLLLPPPLPAVVAGLMVVGVYALGAAGVRRLRGGAADPLEAAAGFVCVAALLAALVHGLAWAGMATAWTLRPIGWGLALSGAVALGRAALHRPHLLADVSSRLRDTPWRMRVAAGLAGVTALALVAAASGPATDADSLDYHLGVPLDWLRHGGAYPRPDWLHARLVGLGEALNLLGLAAGTDGLGAMLQAAGLGVAVVAVTSFARDARDRLFGTLLVLSAPVMTFLVPNQKPQLLPAAATTLSLVLLARRPQGLDAVGAFLALGAAAFAMACKYSFLLTGGVVMMTALVAAARGRRFGPTLVAGAAAVTALVIPVHARNFVFYGDPVSPLLERWRPAGDPAVVAFATELREYGGTVTPWRILRLPWDLMITFEPEKLTTVLGVGVLAVAVTPWAGRAERRLLVPALVVVGLLLAGSQLAPRFFLEPYLWCAAAATGAAWHPLKTLLATLLTAQVGLAAVAALVAAATLVPGALTRNLRDRVMTVAADGYAEAKWLDAILPADAVILIETRSRALFPRPFVVPGRATGSGRERDERLTELLKVHPITAFVASHPLAESRLAPLAACGEPLGAPARFPIATRNPLNRGRTYAVVAMRLAPHRPGCGAAER
jgi:hypothetical protein